ncbi:Hsp20/alpha crystallin family protein [Maribacter sp. 2307ULW6-5]|uniref:Hsp20/alpha crystallin family protein n=1 Tax=Maribacter sp. 2307ULW6-5 TaxID=3386275 RepID=UPI0039BC3EBA
MKPIYNTNAIKDKESLRSDHYFIDGHWPKQGNVVSAGSALPVITEAKPGTHFIIKVRAPQWDRNDLNVNFRENRVIVQVWRKPSERLHTSRTKEEQISRNKVFERAFKVPKRYDLGKTLITFEDNVLHITVPSAATAPLF